MMKRLFVLGALLVSVAAPQDLVKQLDLKNLASKAVDTVEVNLDGVLLKLAEKFLSSHGEEGEAKKLLADIRGIYVRTFRFAKEGEYSMADFEKLRSQVTSGGWTRIVDVRSSRTGGENTGVYLKTDGNQIQGVVVLAAESHELTLVNIDGNIDPARLRDLGGRFGVPRMDFETKKQQKKSGKKEEEE